MDGGMDPVAIKIYFELFFCLKFAVSCLSMPYIKAVPQAPCIHRRGAALTPGVF